MIHYRKFVIAHSLYLLGVGLWPLISMQSFIAVTGYKTDQWLVHQVGLLAIAIGIVLIIASRKYKLDLLLVRLALYSTVSFLFIDVFYSVNGTISKIYLVDALIQLLFGWGHGTVLLRAGRSVQ
jgi:hypothetical protein